ncbi:MAG: AtpZ/AtpI family protein [Oscillospiraceae bacterium]|jgi:ATP synthase protein I|nr:AtpZ/AtpI family protein [Oscillospiraceae bacterium]
MQRDNKNNETLRALSYLSYIGVSLATCVFIGVMLGRFLDSKLGTSPWLLLLFTLLGFGAAVKSIFDMAGKQ